MNTTTLQKDISKLVGLDSLTPAEQEAFLSEVGEVVLESALLRLVAGLTEEQGLALDHYLEDEPGVDVLMKHLVDHYPQFEEILKEEVVAFKEEVSAVLPPTNETDDADEAAGESEVGSVNTN